MLVNKPLTTGASVNPFKSAVVCVAVVVMCGCDQESAPTPVATPVEDMELPDSVTSIGMEFKLIPAGTF